MEYTETKDTKLNPILKDKKIAFSLITLGSSIIVLTFATLEELVNITYPLVLLMYGICWLISLGWFYFLFGE